MITTICKCQPRVAVQLFALVALTTALYTGTGAHETAASPRGDSSGIALRSGATLAPPKVLDLDSNVVDISRTVGSRNGAERRRMINMKVTHELQAEVLFPKDSARLSDEARSHIAAIAQEFEQRSATQVRVAGFTDNLGSSTHGDILSRQRAEAVRDVLIDELSSEVITVDARGFGERHPVASNDTEAGRRRNRRVEVSFTY